MDKKKKLELIAIPVLIMVLILAVAGSFKKGPASGVKGPFIKDAASLKARMAKGASARAMPEKASFSSELTWGRDPFAAHGTTGRGDEFSQGLNLMGISWSSKMNAYSAIINNEIVAVGSRVGRFAVTDIQKDRVTVSDGERSCDLLLAR